MSHRLIAQWNQWLNKVLGQLVLRTEKEIMEKFLSGIYGKHVILVGVPHQTTLINTLVLPCHALVTPFSHSHPAEIKVVESGFYELPFTSGSVDLVVLPHTLELVDNPRQLLAEACRMIKPEGHLILCGFNPSSLWGLNQLMKRKRSTAPLSHSLSLRTLKKWLQLADFELVKQSRALYSPPIENAVFLKKLQFLEWLGKKCHLPWAAVYVLMARAKVVPLTPIRMRWKQSLSGMRVPTSIPGPTIRNAK